MSASATTRVLVVDDDPDVRALLSDYLGQNNVEVVTATCGREAAAVLASQLVDLVVLDLRLGSEDGLQIARHLRDNSAVPIIILSARQEEVDRVMGLELAADDYLTKPFSPRELLARVRAVLRRAQGHEPVVGRAVRRRGYRFAGWELNVRTRRLRSPNATEVVLTNTEFNLLAAFLVAPRRVLSRDQLLELSRLYDDVYDRAIDVQILRLRRKLQEHPSGPQFIRTLRGAGYRFDADVEAY